MTDAAEMETVAAIAVDRATTKDALKVAAKDAPKVIAEDVAHAAAVVDAVDATTAKDRDPMADHANVLTATPSRVMSTAPPKTLPWVPVASLMVCARMRAANARRVTTGPSETIATGVHPVVASAQAKATV